MRDMFHMGLGARSSGPNFLHFRCAETRFAMSCFLFLLSVKQDFWLSEMPSCKGSRQTKVSHPLSLEQREFSFSRLCVLHRTDKEGNSRTMTILAFSRLSINNGNIVVVSGGRRVVHSSRSPTWGHPTQLRDEKCVFQKLKAHCSTLSSSVASPVHLLEVSCYNQSFSELHRAILLQTVEENRRP